MRSLLRVALTLTALVLSNACSDDDGKPNGPVIVVANDAAPQPTSDAGDAASSKKGLGEDCTSPDQCESNVCFAGGKASWCSLACTAANGAQLCTPPAFDGTCNNQGYCRRPN